MTNTNYFKVGLFNAGSLGTKHDELQVAVERNLPDVLAINETWLREGEEGRAPILPGYRLRHLPRPAGRRLRGGGVGFYVRKGLHVRTQLHPPSLTNAEQMWIAVNVKSTRLLIGTAYRPPWFSVDDFFDALTDSLTSFNGHDRVVLLGDFNINCLDENDSKTKRLEQFLEYVDLTNYVTVPTHFTSVSSTLIDLVCTDSNVQSVVVNHIPELGGHAMVLAELKLKRAKIPPKTVSYRPIKDINLGLFNSDLEQFDWKKIEKMESVDEMVSLFSCFVILIYNKHAPKKSILVRDRQLPWFTDNVKHIMSLRDNAYKEFRCSKNDLHKNNYKMLKHLANVSIHFEKTAFFNQKINSNLKNPKCYGKV